MESVPILGQICATFWTLAQGARPFITNRGANENVCLFQRVVFLTTCCGSAAPD